MNSVSYKRNERTNNLNIIFAMTLLRQGQDTLKLYLHSYTHLRNRSFFNRINGVMVTALGMGSRSTL